MIAGVLVFGGLVFCIIAVIFLLKKTDDKAVSSMVDAEASKQSQCDLETAWSDVNNDDNEIYSNDVAPWDLVSTTNTRIEVVEAIPAKIYDDVLFDEHTSGSIKQQMADQITIAGIPQPTASQWNMITSPAAVTQVIAGAGSGKSTALSLRAVFLHKFLNIPLEQLTIVTFTRASRADMVKKLVRDMGLFQINLTEAAARRVVRTFHSMIIEQAKDPFGDTMHFEQIGGKVDDADEGDGLSSLNNKQLDHLRAAFAKTYKSNPLFRRSVGQVLLEKLAIPRLSQYGDMESLDRAIAVAEPRDRLVTQAITDAWLAKPGFDPQKGIIEWGATAIKTSRAGGVWYANGRVTATGMPIVLGCGGIKDVAQEPLNQAKYPLMDGDKDRTLNFIGNVRLKVVATIAIEKYLYIETDEDLSDLYLLTDWAYRSQSIQDSGTFPAFSLRIPGDSNSSSIFESLYSVGTFIGSMGVDVALASKVIAVQLEQTDCSLEANLCRALAEFWPALHEQNHSTYDNLFFRHGDYQYLATLSLDRLLPMKHLLIDEFQDISGQIVRWIKAVHSVLSQHGENPSLLAVGDDWQSVYGWRGSDPEFMIRFDDHFGGSKLITMTENFRSGQHIINTAEMLVERLSESALKKHGVASGHAANALGDVELCTGGNDEILKLIESLRRDDPDGEIFILSRTNEGLMPFRKISKGNKITLLTMHRAKGLEADYVIIKGDCNYLSSSPLRNAIYAQARMLNSYDVAQQDESLRLAYVSITRAKKKAWWFGEPSKPGGAFRVLNAAICGGEIHDAPVKIAPHVNRGRSQQ